MKLIVKDKNGMKKESELVCITRDGWVHGKDGAFGDHEEDCSIYVEGEVEFIKEVMERLNLTQQELGWILGVSRPTAISILQGKRGLTLKEYLLLQKVVF